MNLLDNMIGNYIKERTHKLTFNSLERQTDE